MVVLKERPPLLVTKLAATLILIIGFLVMASGYRYDSVMTAVGGAFLVAVGVLMLVMKIVRRNRDGAV